MTRYVLDNASEQTGQRFTSLETCFDPVSIGQLEQIGVAEGWSCLEVGGGGGSIARWLSRRVGPSGNVLVTDINPRWLDAGSSNIELRRHDITATRYLSKPSISCTHVSYCCIFQIVAKR